jgi:uncharacterized protein (DUF885 family)
MKPLYTLIIILLTFMNLAAQETADKRLWDLFDQMHQFNMRNFPEWATYEGDHRFNDRLTDISEEGIMARRDSTRMFLKILQDIPYEELNAENKLNYDLLKEELEEDIYTERFNNYYMQIGQQGGLHIDFPQMVDVQPLVTVEDYEKYFARLRGFTTQVDNVISHMRKGMASAIVMPRFIMEQTLPQMESIYNVEPEKSVFYAEPKSIESYEMKPADREKVKSEMKQIIETVINPGYRKLHDFVRDEYMPVTRTEAGIWSLPGGKERYEYAVQNYTTLKIDADSIFNLGMSEVERIKKEMEKVKESTGFNGTLEEFNNYLRTNPQFYYTTKDSLLNGFRTILKRMDTKLPQLFGRLPQAKYDLKELEEFRAKSAPAAYYYSAPEDRSRPGYFYVNTYNLSSRPKFTMTALALHEAVPGHHLQIAIAQELKGLPRFRRDLGVTAFVEGWGLYAEYLGYETGMYDDPYQRYGALTFEMWRACRLVVDAGIHYKRWTREEARDFMRQNAPLSETDIESEIDRYIAWAGQALAYKVGELKLKELRRKAEEKLGDKFDIRSFHDAVLENGAIPLPLLEKKIDEWIAKQL